MDFETDTPKNSPNEPEIDRHFDRFYLPRCGSTRTQKFPALKGRTHVSRQSPNPRGRKGTAKVPAEFKRVIDEKYNEKFYITSLDGKVGQVYPFEEWERIEQKLAGLSTFNPTKKKFLDRVNYYGQMVEMDGQGQAADSAVVAGSGAAQRRSGSDRQSYPSR